MTLTARAVLKANLLLGSLPEPAIDKLAALAIRRSYRRGTQIFAQGEPGDALLGLISGQVRISASTAGGQEVFLNILESGDSFGEIAALRSVSERTVQRDWRTARLLLHRTLEEPAGP